MNNIAKSLKIITSIFATITAFLLVLWVVDLTDSETTRDLIVKLAMISGIVAALSAVLQLLGGSEKK